MREACSITVLCLLGTVGLAQNVAAVYRKAIHDKDFMWIYKKNHPGINSASYED